MHTASIAENRFDHVLVLSRIFQRKNIFDSLVFFMWPRLKIKKWSLHLLDKNGSSFFDFYIGAYDIMSVQYSVAHL